MKVEKLNIEFSVFTDISELDEQKRRVYESSLDAKEGAYAPYSKFKVGAAIQLNNGQIIIGSNQENIAYPSGLCAERVALFAAKSKYPDSTVTMIAISSDRITSDSLLSPCGSCRQVIAEIEMQQNSPIVIFFGPENGSIIQLDSAKALLPLSFLNKSLKE